ncbi:MSHA biogenesis protein MshF [uncultured Vibrio sp.]|uniref:MSHA biogenesis protein MshF n=1 Tax=uncultured Vibrio sp. TaxID=114054 RepID=UPI00091B914E|nr:MSHA biogenesis protein MshF [uncultured Vibrio sp.]OIQ24849.1 MAG: MSHA biogenesis protein MshF [Vibrio sp. MedPE-SWchi]
MDKGQSQFVIWLLLVVVLVLSFMLAWQKVDKEATDTAMLVASKRIIERANYYKQEWLLNKQPPKLLIDGEMLTMSRSGWVMPIDQEKQANCLYWLKVLYPENRGLESSQVGMVDDVDNMKYQCRYTGDGNQVIVIQLVNDKFTVSVDFLTEA